MAGAGREAQVSQQEQEPVMEEARRVALARLEEIRIRLEKAREEADSNSLFALEADLQVIGALAEVTAQQVLRVLQESGMLRDAARAWAETRSDEIADQRATHEGNR